MNWVNDPNLLSILNTGFVFVGRNGASTYGTQDGHFEQPWANFHSGYSYQNDYKMRYAFRGTRYWGSYMTDIIKNYNESDSNSMRSYLKTHPEVVKETVQILEAELDLLGNRSVLVALESDTYRILNEYLGSKYKVVKVLNYSYTIGKEDYREAVLSVLDKLS